MPVQFAEWRPDIALLDVQFASEAHNVFAGSNSYLPFPRLAPFSAAPLADAHGLFIARRIDGSWKVFAGTSTKLYTWDTDAWTDVSRTAGGDYNVAPDDLWMWEQSGQHLVAVNENDDPQVIDIDAGTNFAALAGSPPRATNVKQIGDFLVLSGLAANKRIIQWSGINDITQWTIGVGLSDMQEFPDSPVQSVQGSEIGYVVQDRSIRTMQFLPGDLTFIFNFSRVLSDRGCCSKYGATSVGNVLYFLGESGFFSVSGQQVQTIGAEKVDDWFLTHSDIGRRNVVHAIAGINKPRIAWAYHSFSGSQMYDHVIIFHWDTGKWTHATQLAKVWALQASPSIHLDIDSAEPDDPELDSAASPLDSFLYAGGRPLVGAINADGYLSALTGPALQATLETAEVHLVPGMRAFVNDAYPLADGLAESVMAGIRERLADPVVWGVPAPLEITGKAALFSSARLHRFRVRIPAGELWTHAQGVMVEAQQDGSLA